MTAIWIFLITFLAIGFVADAARILAIFPFPSQSHQTINHELARALARRGHELTVFTADPMKKVIPNYTEYSLNYFYKDVNRLMNYVEIGKRGPFDHLQKIYELSERISEGVLSENEMKQLLSPNSTVKFDLIIMAVGFWEAIYYIADILHLPMIGITSLPGLTVHHIQIGNPLLPTILPDIILPYTSEMSIWEKIHNSYYVIRQFYEYYFILLPKQEKIMKKYFGMNVPAVDELKNRLSLMFINTHSLIHHPRPMAPSAIPIGGFRIGTINKTLPGEFKKLLDQSKQGFIYFSLGTNVKTTDLKLEVITKFTNIFSKLPYLILWKLDNDSLPGKPNNVIIRKWVPQHGVLAHPNIKLFIYHGGLLSTEEAIECSVPVIGAPVFIDQRFNVNALIKKQAGASINLHESSEDEIIQAIHEVINNPRYKNNMIKLRTLLHDRPMHTLDEAVWWTEYVIRHKGAPFLRTPIQFWQHLDIFIISALYVAVFLALSFLIWKSLYCTINTCNRYVIGRSTIINEQIQKMKTT